MIKLFNLRSEENIMNIIWRAPVPFYFPCSTTILCQRPGFIILREHCWQSTHLYVAEYALVGGRAILLPSAPCRAKVAHYPHWFQLAGGATNEPVKTQGGAFRSCQLRLSTQLHKLTCTKWRAKNPIDDGLNKWGNNELLRMHNNWQCICLSFCWTLCHPKKNKTQLTNYK